MAVTFEKSACGRYLNATAEHIDATGKTHAQRLSISRRGDWFYTSDQFVGERQGRGFGMYAVNAEKHNHPCFVADFQQLADKFKDTLHYWGYADVVINPDDLKTLKNS